MFMALNTRPDGLIASERPCTGSEYVRTLSPSQDPDDPSPTDVPIVEQEPVFSMASLRLRSRFQISV
jgi:hypothetical protein